MDYTENEKLEKLGYSAKWLEYGFLTPDLLAAQVDNAGTDINGLHCGEHYRYAAFNHYLAARKTLSDSEFERYAELVALDADAGMAGAALVDLFEKIDLTDAQFERLAAQIRRFGDYQEKLVTRQTLLRALKRNELTDALFEQCLENGDGVIHEYLLDIANQAQLERLSVQGKTKRTRNRAAQKAGIKRSKKPG